MTPSPGDPIQLPWRTGFEDPFCDYPQVAGVCYNGGDTGRNADPASHFIVTSPTPHSGSFAAAFSVVGDGEVPESQTRCYRQGVLPSKAFYGAWYYIPATATNDGNWNLLHFRGSDEVSGVTHGLWDVSLWNSPGPGGKLLTRVLNLMPRPGSSAAALGHEVPIGRWFHLVFYLNRSKDATGEVALYQDGVRVVEFKNLRTDDSNWGQWYVGNLATMLSPAESTLYVDDVSIEDTEPTD